jgi:hypothetical protein
MSLSLFQSFLTLDLLACYCFVTHVLRLISGRGSAVGESVNGLRAS